LVRVLQEGVVRRLGGSEDITVDVKIIATTNEPPLLLIKNGRLREDLFYRLSVIYVEIPPLRERIADIEILTEYFIKKFNNKFNKTIVGCNKTVINIFREYHWPGNVRELEHVIEALMNFTDEAQITPEHLQFLSFGAFKNYLLREDMEQKQIKHRVDDYEKQLIIEILRETGGNIAQAAKKMQMKRQALQYKLKKYSISKEEILWQ